jgi:hypothetical protein
MATPTSDKLRMPTNFKTFVPETREDAFKISPVSKILPTSAGVSFVPLGGGSLSLNSADIATITKRTKAISDKSKNYNQSKGKVVSDKAEKDDLIARQLKRYYEESKAFVYTNPYFAGPQVGVFIADKWVANIVTIEYTESSTDSPVYGYNSRYYDAVMEGNVIVQGSFTIALTDGDYLGRFIENYQATEGQNDGSTEMIKDEITKARETWWGRSKDNPIGVVAPMNFRHTSSLSGAVGRGFDVRIFYGAGEFLEDPDKKLDGPIDVIRDMHITGRNVVVTPSGDPVGEGWTFFARSIQTTKTDKSPVSTRSTPLRRQEPPSQANKLWLPIRNLGGSVRPGSL